MRNLILSALSAGLLFASAPATPASAAVRADINLQFGDAPRVYFARPPRTILIPDTQVYYVQGMDYDMFQCDGWWYIDNGGYWFRSSSYRGPFVAVSFDYVPRMLFNVPSAYAHQPYRPGVWRSDSRSYGYGSPYRNGSGTSYRNRRTTDNRNGQDSDQRWQQQQQQRQGWQQQNSQNNRGDQNNRGYQGNRGDQGNQGNNHGRGHGKNNGNGHGRGQDN
jgi:hypothetical protein